MNKSILLIFTFIISISSFGNESCFSILKGLQASIQNRYELESWDQLNFKDVKRYDLIKIAIRINQKFNANIEDISESDLNSFLKKIKSPIQTSKGLQDLISKNFSDKNDFIDALAPNGLSDEKILILFEAHKQLGAVDFKSSHISLRNFDYYEQLAKRYLFMDLDPRKLKNYLIKEFGPKITGLKQFLHFESDIEITKNHFVEILKKLDSQGFDISSQKSLKAIDESFQRTTIEVLKKSINPSHFLTIISKSKIKYEELLSEVFTSTQLESIKNSNIFAPTLNDYIKVFQALKSEGVEISTRSGILSSNFLMEEVTQKHFGKRMSPSTFLLRMKEKGFSIREILNDKIFKDDLEKLEIRNLNIVNDDNTIIFLKEIKKRFPSYTLKEAIENHDSKIFNEISFKLFGKVYPTKRLLAYIHSSKETSLEVFYQKSGFNIEYEKIVRKKKITKSVLSKIEEIFIELDKAGVNLVSQTSFISDSEAIKKITKNLTGYEVSPFMLSHYRKMKYPSLLIMLKKLELKKQLKQHEKEEGALLSKYEFEVLTTKLKSTGVKYSNILDFLKDSKNIKALGYDLFGINISTYKLLKRYFKESKDFNLAFNIPYEENKLFVSILLKELHDSGIDISTPQNLQSFDTEVTSFFQNKFKVQISGHDIYNTLKMIPRNYKTILSEVDLDHIVPTYISEVSNSIATKIRELGYPKQFNTLNNYNAAKGVATDVYGKDFSKDELLKILKKEFKGRYALFKIKHRLNEIEPLFKEYITSLKWDFSKNTTVDNTSFLKDALKNFYGSTPSMLRVIRFADRMSFLNLSDFDFPEGLMRIYEGHEVSNSLDRPTDRVIRDHEDPTKFEIASDLTPEDLVENEQNIAQIIAIEFDLLDLENSDKILDTVVNDGIISKSILLEMYPENEETIVLILKTIMENREAILELLI